MGCAVKLFLIAGEPSGDALGASLMAGLKAARSDIEFSGIGGPLMQAEGLNSLFPMSDLSDSQWVSPSPNQYLSRHRYLHSEDKFYSTLRVGPLNHLDQ